MYRISYCMTTKHILRYPHHQTKRYCVQQCAVAVVPGKRRWCTKTLFIVAFEPKALSVYRNRVLNALLKLLCGSPNRANGMDKKKRTKTKNKKGKKQKGQLREGDFKRLVTAQYRLTRGSLLCVDEGAYGVLLYTGVSKGSRCAYEAFLLDVRKVANILESWHLPQPGDMYCHRRYAPPTSGYWPTTDP